MIGKHLLYKLAELAVKEGSIGEAEDYYREFCDLAPDDPGQYILRYLILGAKGAPVEQLIHTLEQYCNIELDEKWLYELAKLYSQAGMNELCVMACDKLMLMFGLGKYVDKAMELKLQYAPLTGYQMDLVENRDKYEAKLKAVEQEYRQGTPIIPMPELEKRRTVETRQPQTAYEQPVYTEEQEAVAEAALSADYESNMQENEELPREEVTVESEDTAAFQEQSWETAAVKEPPVPEDTMKARLHEAEAQANLAREMSRISEEPNNYQEEETAQTRVLADIRDLNRESAYKGSNHLMIEAAIPEEGFNLAVEALKKIHRETGAKNQVAKITGEKLNRRGIFTISDKLTGRDLIIEQAGDMNEAILQELNQLMARDETGMNIILIDTPERLEELHRVYPGLAKRFECIEASETLKTSSSPAEKEAPVHQEAQPPQAKPAPADVPAGQRPVVLQENGGQKRPRVQQGAAAVQPKTTPQPAAAVPAKEAQSEDGRPIRRVQPSRDNHPALAQPAPKVTVRNSTAQRENEPEDEEEMDIDDFAQYACQYASDIDCSISGKSMLALYERIEMMEEDGIPLTKANAEDLIEEAADRAEKPSLTKRITGIFSSKYDKDGLLILKEEHFI